MEKKIGRRRKYGKGDRKNEKESMNEKVLKK